MRKIAFCSAFLFAVCSSQALWAQHADVEFGYDDLGNPTGIVIENDDETLEGFQFWEAGFEELDPNNPGDWSADEPGFTTEDSEGLLFNDADQIWLCPIDASLQSIFGVGYVNYYNPATGMLEATNRVSLIDNTTGTSDLIMDGATATGDALQFLGSVDSDGDLHDHVVFDLLDDASAPAGAYGIMFQVHADFASADGTPDLVSAPLWFIFNHQMDEEEFDSNALRAFGVVPEPSSLALLFAGSTCLLVRRRK